MVLAIVVVAVSFQIANSKFLQNLVNLFEQSGIYMVLAIAEIFTLLLGEIDLSVGLVMALSGATVAPAGAADRRGLALVAGDHRGVARVRAGWGAFQGSLVARLRIVVRASPWAGY